MANTFGMYGGKVLEKITHNEDPWMEARKGYGDRIPSSELFLPHLGYGTSFEKQFSDT